MCALFVLLNTIEQRLTYSGAGAGWSVANPIGFMPGTCLDTPLFYVPWLLRWVC
jgi:hypothetical protein